MSLHRFSFLLLTGMLSPLIGCGGKVPTNPSDPAVVTPAETKGDNPSKQVAAVDEKPTPPKIDDDSAVAAVQKALKALEAGKLAEAYEFLPPSFQSDIDGLIHEFADRMDPEVWSKLSVTLRKAIQVLRTKKDLIFGLDLFRDRPEAEPYRKQWDSIMEAINAIGESDVTNLVKLKQVTAKSLLSTTSSPSLEHLDTFGRAIGADLSRRFAGLKVTLVQSNGAEQTIGLQAPNDEKPIEIVYVKHDGHWLPKSMVEHWPQGIAEDRAWLQKFPEHIRAVKSQLLEAAYQADETLDQLQAATNRDEFEKAAGPAILSLAVEWPRLRQLSINAVAGSNQNPNVTISINRELTEAELTKLVTNVLKPLNQSGSDYTLFSNDGRTICRVLRVVDIPALQASLATHFNLTEKSIAFDRNKSTIQIDLAP